MKRNIIIDPWFRIQTDYTPKDYIPRWIRELYVYLAKKGLKTSQVRFYLDSDGLPFLSTVSPTDGSWGEEYTVQEFIDLVYKRLQDDT